MYSVHGGDESNACNDICRDARNLNLSNPGAQNIIGFEGYSESAYQVGGDVPTIGFGHTAGVEMGDTMTGVEATAALVSDVNVAERTVEGLVGNLPVSQREFDALADLAFNVGQTELNAQNSPGLNGAIAAGDYEGIGNNLRYTRGPDGPSPGLVERSNSRQNIFRSGDYSIGQRRYVDVWNRQARGR